MSSRNEIVDKIKGVLIDIYEDVMKDVGDQIDILVGYLVSKKNTRSRGLNSYRNACFLFNFSNYFTDNTTFVVTKACKRRGNMDKGFTIIEILKYLLLTDKFMKGRCS